MRVGSVCWLLYCMVVGFGGSLILWLVALFGLVGLWVLDWWRNEVCLVGLIVI